MKKLLSLVFLIGSLGIGSVFAVQLDSSNIVSMGCPVDYTSCNLQQKGITSIAPGTFINHTRLMDLNLLGNSITSVSAAALEGLGDLYHLNLAGNEIRNLNNCDFSPLVSLDNLDLSENGISDISKINSIGISKRNWQSINLQRNRIVSIGTGSFNGMTNLSTLDLRFNQIKQIKKGDFDGIPHLYRLNLAGNKIASIESGSFLGLSELQTLHLGENYSSYSDSEGNNITSIDNGDFAGLSSLTELWLRNNDLYSIEPGSFSGLSMLGELIIANGMHPKTGPLTISSGSFLGLNNLRKLILTSQLLTGLQYGSFIGLANLIQLGIGGYGGGNSIANIESGAFVGLSNLTGLDLSYNKINSIENGDFAGLSSLTFLNLSQNKISSIENGDFLGLSNLPSLDLSYNTISSIESGDFNGLSTLLSLNLAGNNISVIDVHTFSLLPSLTSLNISDNDIADIQSGSFAGLSNVTSLDIGGNAISIIESGDFNGLNNLKILSMNNSDITTITSLSFPGSSNIETLSLVGNRIESINSGIFIGWDNLKTLYLGSNKIKNIPRGAFNGLTNLKELSLEYTCGYNWPAVNCEIDPYRITSIESGAFVGLSNLRNLNLYANAITGIENGDFVGLSSLTGLNLNFNAIANIESGAFVGLSNLTSLGIYGNKISIIEGGLFVGLSNLTGLYIGQNLINSIKKGTFNGLVNLKDLDLNNNKIVNIESGSFVGLSNLLKLNLNSNLLKSINRGYFEGLTSLQELDLSYGSTFYDANHVFIQQHDAITNIESGAFIGLSNLLNLNLNLNEIRSIEKGDFVGLSKLTYLDLTQNQITNIESGSFSTLTKLKGVIYNTVSQTHLQGLRFDSNCLDDDSQAYINSIPDKWDNLGLGSIAQNQYVCLAISYTPSISTPGSVEGRLVFTGGLATQRDALIAANPTLASHTRTANGSYGFDLTTLEIVGAYPKFYPWYIGAPEPGQSFDTRFAYKKILTGNVTWITQSLLQTTPTISYSNTLPTSGDVTATISFSNGGTITNNSGSNTKFFTNNGTFTFDFADLAGHTGSAVASVSNIDKTKPTSTVSYVTNENGSVTATLTLSETGTISNTAGVITVTPGFIFSHTFTEIGSFTFNFADLVGNTGTRTVTINSMSSTPGDTTPPTGIISYTTNPNGSVTATITLSEVGNIVNNGGSNQYTFTSNGSFIFQFNDLAGNTGYATANVTSITTNNNGENTNSTDTTPPTCLVSNTSTFSGSYLHLEWGCSDDLQLSGLSLTINDENNNLIYSTGLSVSSTDFKYYTDSGIYKRKIIASDKAGNKSTMNYKTINYQKLTAINISPSGYFYDDIYYISGYRAILSITGNTRFGFKIVGDVSNTIVGSYTTGVLNQTIIFDQGEGFKTVLMNYITSNQSDSGATDPITFYVDTTSPSIIPIYPLDLSNSTGSSMNFEWSATDTGVGISGYVLEITRSTRKPTLVYLGATSTNYTLTKMSNGTYSWKLKAIDYAGNTKETASSTFTIGTTLPTGDISPDSFSLDKEYDADLNEEYESEIVTVSGLSTGTKVLAYVSNGSLIINGDDVGTSGYVQNKDKVQIAMYSSKKYDTLSSGTLTIGDQFSNFKIVTRTKDDDSGMYTVTSLSNSEKLNISLVYNALLGIYDEDEQDDFMLSFKYIVKDKIDKMIDNDEDETKIEKMKYLYNIINKNFKGEEDSTIIDATEDTTSSNNDETIKYTAPNNKEYTITHDSKGYTSSTFLKSGKYFNSLSEIKTYINKNNPKSPYHMIDFTIDTTWNQSYTAPNGKKYVLFKTTDGRYGSNSFIYGKTFTSLNAIQTYINQNNQY